MQLILDKNLKISTFKFIYSLLGLTSSWINVVILVNLCTCHGSNSVINYLRSKTKLYETRSNKERTMIWFMSIVTLSWQIWKKGWKVRGTEKRESLFWRFMSIWLFYLKFGRSRLSHGCISSSPFYVKIGVDWSSENTELHLYLVLFYRVVGCRHAYSGR